MGNDYNTLIIPTRTKKITYELIEPYKNDLEKVVIPKSVKIIGRNAFCRCNNLREVEIGGNLQYIFDNAFDSCVKLKKINIPDSVEEIGMASFSCCYELEEIKLPNQLLYVDEYAFENCAGLRKVEFGNNIESIGYQAFDSCASLKEINFPNSIKYIDNEAFFGCIGLESIKIPGSVISVGNLAFAGCNMLKNVKLEEGIKELRCGVFKNCDSLKQLHIPKSIQKMDYDLIGEFTKLEDKSFWYTTKIGRFPQNVKYITTNLKDDDFYFLNGAKLKFEDKTIQLEGVRKYSAIKYGFICELENGDIIYPSDKGEFREINREILEEKANEFNQLEKLSFEHSYKMGKWGKYESVPSYVVVEQMPYEEIDLFYKDNNKTNWQKLIKASKFEEVNQKGSLFALAHALGVFSENGVESKQATDFILNEILTYYTGEQIHSAVGGFNVDNTPYNPEYAKFFMKYFNGFDFMVTKIDKMGGMEVEEVNLLASSHNNFIVVQKVFPEKKVITRQDRERLTPGIVKDVLTRTIYQNIDESAEELAVKVGRLGYTQEQFNKLQEWYLIAKDIPKGELSIVCEKDNEDEVITYEVLEKTNPLGAVIGTLTNCCQVVGGAGEECVEYGMTQPNSTFIAFRQGERLVGQAWVWYDKTTKQVTLDNIEVPNKVIGDLQKPKNEHLREAYLECIDRLGKNLVKTMNENFERSYREDRVERVTIGLGCNDFAKLLKNRYGKTKQPLVLTGYTGYSDATKEDGQVIVVKLSKEKISLKCNEK